VQFASSGKYMPKVHVDRDYSIRASRALITIL
jgi:hypothetical protein